MQKRYTQKEREIILVELERSAHGLILHIKVPGRENLVFGEVQALKKAIVAYEETQNI